LAALAGACSVSNSDKPRIDDFAFFRYAVYQGDSLIFSATAEPGDTAQTFVENPDLHSGDIFMEALMRHLPHMYVGDSSSFAIGNQYRGVLHLLHFVAKEDYPKYIEEGDKRRAAFEVRLEEIKKEMDELEPAYKARAEAVADSTRRWAELLRTGELDGQLNAFPPGIRYLLIERGSGPLANKTSSWTWVHFCAALPNGDILLNTFARKPVVVNRRGALLAPWVEKSVTQFPEGSRILLAVPYELAFGEEGNVPVPQGSDLYILLEVLRANNM